MLPGTGFSAAAGITEDTGRIVQGQQHIPSLASAFALAYEVGVLPALHSHQNREKGLRNILEGIGTWVVGEKGRGINQKKKKA